LVKDGIFTLVALEQACELVVKEQIGRLFVLKCERGLFQRFRVRVVLRNELELVLELLDANALSYCVLELFSF
jgi:hypothetical protein